MGRPQPPTLNDVRLCASRMASNAADALNLVPAFAELVEGLQPADSLLRSRPEFERGALWSYPALFEFVEANSEQPLQVLTAQTDLWIRGVNCTVITGFQQGSGGAAEGLIFSVLSLLYGRNSRFIIEAKWRLDEAQGFISRGTSETFAPAVLITGDGEYNAPLDWVIEKDETIEVSIRSLVPQLLGTAQPETPLPPLRAVWIAFWGEDLRGQIGAGRVRR